MKISLRVIGKTDKGYLEEGIEVYSSRIKKYIPFSMDVIPHSKKASSLPPDVRKTEEGQQILNSLEKDDVLVLLDEKGKKYSSVEFAGFIDNQMITSTKRLVFMIGGAFGFSDPVYKRANYKLSLSDMTFSHQIVRVLFLEQLYRAFTIIRGEPYHNE